MGVNVCACKKRNNHGRSSAIECRRRFLKERPLKGRHLQRIFIKSKLIKRMFIKGILGLVFLVAVAGGALKVCSQESREVSVDQESYRKMEKEYLAAVKLLLEEEGFKNSGVTLTKEYNGNGTRDYRILIHHKGIKRLSADEQLLLQKKLQSISFPIPGCIFFHKFLVGDFS